MKSRTLELLSDLDDLITENKYLIDKYEDEFSLKITQKSLLEHRKQLLKELENENNNNSNRRT